MTGRQIALPAEWVNDPNLSATDLGILVRVIDQSWSREGVLTIRDLSIGNGPAMTRASLARLIDLGYLHRERLRTAGKLRGYAYTVVAPHE